MALIRPSIIITGASYGIGLAVARACISRFNSNVLAIDRTISSDLSSLKTVGLNPTIGKLEILQGDVRDEKILKTAVEQCLESWGQLNGVVANAGIVEPLGYIANTKLEDWKSTFDINFFSILSLIQHSIPHLRRSKGTVITLASLSSLKSLSGMGAYSTTKAALDTLTKALAVEEPDIISISFRPGLCDTNLTKIIREKGENRIGKNFHEIYKILYEKKKYLHPDTPAHVIANLVTGGAEKELSGRYLSWNDFDLGKFQE